MKWRPFSYICLAVALAVLGVWVWHGAQVFTKSARQKVVRDELFGTQTVEWEEGLWVGLDAAGPIAGICLAIGAYGFFRSRR